MYHTFCIELHYIALERIITAQAKSITKAYKLQHTRVESIIIDFNYIIWSTEHCRRQIARENSTHVCSHAAFMSLMM